MLNLVVTALNLFVYAVEKVAALIVLLYFAGAFLGLGWAGLRYLHRRLKGS